MNLGDHTSRSIGPRAWAIFCILFTGVVAQAGIFDFESAGARLGIPANKSSAGFGEAEVYVDWNLRRPWDLGREWHMQPRLDLAAGWLGNHGVDAAIASFGPTLVLGWKQFPVSLEGGISPTIITRDDFATKDFGIPFQFTGYAGVSCDLFGHFRLGYRWQHMSNAGLSASNPGLNLQVLALSYIF